MKAIIWASLAGIAGLLAACASNPPPVPLEGDAQTLTQLAGEWSGEYESEESGRFGRIAFRLTAAGDSAFGHVIMKSGPHLSWMPPFVPAREESEWGLADDPAVSSDLLTIKFVRARAGAITGTLDEYLDPRCECRVRTRFEGQLEGDVIEGNYETLHMPSGLVQHGWWRVERESD